jgi:V/A-type H+-transporting ATPase subunit B
MKDGIGENFTRKDHPAAAAKLFAAYAQAEEIRALATVIGADDLSPEEKQSLNFATKFETEFVSQTTSRTMHKTLEIAQEILQKTCTSPPIALF